MKELYEKVAKDSALQKKFAEIMTEAEKAGPEETGRKLVAFARESGYEVTIEEMAEFFNILETKESALSEEELDEVAGGEISNSKPKLSMSGRGCPIRLSDLNSSGQQCPLTDH